MSTTKAKGNENSRRTFDFDLHGIVGIRLLDATDEDVAKVARQLGPLDRPLTNDPDILVRFVDRATDEPLTYVGVGQAGYNREGFFVIQGPARTAAKARLPLDDIGHRPEILCERSLRAVPHLLAIINLSALAKGVLPLHASAFNLGSLGVLVTGWAKSGKTESLLAGVAEGADYVGDEWVYLTPDGTMLGLPEPIRLWGWHLEQVPQVLANRSRRERLRLKTWRTVAGVVDALSSSPLPGAALARRGAPALKRQAYLQIPPRELFGPGRVTLRGRLDAVVLVASHTDPLITTSPVGPTEISGRMARSLADERAPFLQHYRQFRFAFPDRSSEVVDLAEATEARLLSSLFDGRRAACVAHPYPCDIRELGRAVVDAAHAVAQPESAWRWAAGS